MSDTRTNIPATVTEIKGGWLRVMPDDPALAPEALRKWGSSFSVYGKLARCQVGDKGFLSYVATPSSGLWHFHAEECPISPRPPV